MAERKENTLSVEDALHMFFEEDLEHPVCPADSSSDDDDLVHPDLTVYGPDSGDSDYIPLSESDDDDPRQPSTSQEGVQRGRPTCPTSVPLTQLSSPFVSNSPVDRQPKRKGKHMQKTPSKCRRGEYERSQVREEEERWHERQERDQKPDPLPFMPARIPGPTFDTTTSWSPLSLFQMFFSASVVQTIINNTNANAAKRQQAGKQFRWEELTVKSFYTFLAIIFFSGLVTVHNRADLWKKKFPYNFSFPGDKMSRWHFEAILWSLHLSNPEEDEENERKRNTAEYDRLFKIKPLCNEMVQACKAHFHPHKNISIDERVVATKARISLKQHMKDKPAKWGYKLFVLADASTGYTWNFFVYTGESVSTTGQDLSYSAVMELLPLSLLGGGYTVYTDNFHTSPALFQDLVKKEIGCCGTIRKNNVGFPQTLNNDLPKKAERGDLRWIRSNRLLFVKWMDTREVTMCSSVHEAFSGQTVKRKVKEAGVWQMKSIPVPDAVVDYSHNMGGLDVFDALSGHYSVLHKTMKWYKTFFFHFVDIAVVNSFILHKELIKLRNDPTQTKTHTQKIFREQLITQMLEFAEGSVPSPLPDSSPITCMPLFYESGDSRMRKHCKRCLDAGIPRVKTGIFCRKCQVPLCLTSKKNCFQLWHDEHFTDF